MRGAGEGEGEGGSLTDGAGDGDVAAVGFGQGFDDGEAEAGAVGGAVAGTFDAVEAVEDEGGQWGQVTTFIPDSGDGGWRWWFHPSLPAAHALHPWPSP